MITILVVDDECILREIMAEILVSEGYRVLQAADGLEAMHVFQEHRQHIRLALLDVLMPGCCGIELAQRIRKLNPELPIIFVTGYDRTLLSERSHQLSNFEVLRKPVCIKLLVQSIEQAVRR